MQTPPTISLLLPTYGRPALAERFFRSVVEHTTNLSNVEVVLYVDEDDTASHHIESLGVRTTRIIGPQATMGTYNMSCLALARGRIVILVNDDMVVASKGWDEKVIALDESIPDRIYLAYGNDLFKKSKLCTFPILSRRTCELLVEPYPKAYKGAFIDVDLFDVFMRLKHAGFDRIRYLEDVVFEHRHYRNNKAPFDETYRRRGRFDDDWVFLAQGEARRAGAQRLYAAIQGDEPAPYRPKASTVAKPTGAVNAFSMYTRELLFDGDLSLRWRGYLWVWFFGRYLASRGWLGPLGRPRGAA